MSSGASTTRGTRERGHPRPSTSSGIGARAKEWTSTRSPRKRPKEEGGARRQPRREEQREESPTPPKRSRQHRASPITASSTPAEREKRNQHIRDKLRKAVLQEKAEELRKQVKELTHAKQKFEEKSEARKTKIHDMESRLREKDRANRELTRKLDKVRLDKVREMKEKDQMVKGKDKTITALKDQVRSLKKKLEKAEMERVKAESMTTAAGGGTEAFFRDVMGNFKELVENNLQCSVCSELLVFATTISCGHSFCEECVEEWKQTKDDRADCPMCRSQIDGQASNRTIDDYVEKVVDNFFPEDAKEARRVLVGERRAKRDARQERRRAAREQEEREENEPVPGGMIIHRIYRPPSSGRPMRQLVIDSDSSDSDVSWSPSHAIRSVSITLPRYSPPSSDFTSSSSSSASSSSSSSSSRASVRSNQGSPSFARRFARPVSDEDTDQEQDLLSTPRSDTPVPRPFSDDDDDSDVVISQRSNLRFESDNEQEEEYYSTGSWSERDDDDDHDGSARGNYDSPRYVSSDSYESSDNEGGGAVFSSGYEDD